jgi:periplasmic protein TonB
MGTSRSIDSPWHRLPWTLPTALLIWAVALLGLAYFMEKPTHRPLEPSAIDAQLLVEQSASPASAAVQKPKPLPQVRPQPAPVISKVTPTAEQKPSVQKAEEATNAPSSAQATPSEGPVTGTVNTSTNTRPQAGSYYGTGSSQGDINANSGARAIIQPMPQIPDDMRAEAFNFAALARFHIAVDGSVKVELAKPTPNPRLNRILLDSLKKWRFIPAIKNGKPVDSTEDIVVKIEVK